MKKIMKSMLLLLAATTGLTLASCSDDDNLTQADALFRPIISESDNIKHALDEDLRPYMTINWDNYTDANQYVVSIAANDGSDTRTITTDTTTYVFTGLEYDKEYNISIRCENTITGLSSKDFTLTTTTLDYPTKLATIGTSDIIDNAARISWSEDAELDSVQILKDSNDSLVYTIDLSAIDALVTNSIVTGLEPKTTYKAVAYKEDAYRGKKRFTTVAEESFKGVVFDLRDLDPSDSKGYITTDQIAMDVAENPDEDITYVLHGGYDYKIGGGTTFPEFAHKITFITGLTLEGNARFISGGGMTISGDVEALTFEKIDFVSDKLNNGDVDLYENTDKGWGGRQAVNFNGVKATLSNLTFKSCTIQGYRAMVRTQKDDDNITNILVEDCVINAIGDQGVFTSTNKKGKWEKVTMKNTTVTNIVMLCDFRINTEKNKLPIELNIENCTFCYAPMETTANANTPLFRVGDATTIKVNNSLFGPAMATDGSAGGSIMPYTAATAGSIYVTGNPTTDVVNSYKTNFEWTGREDAATGEIVTNPLDGLVSLSLDENQLWSDPAKGKFNIIGSASGVDFSTLGDARWW